MEGLLWRIWQHVMVELQTAWDKKKKSDFEDTFCWNLITYLKKKISWKKIKTFQPHDAVWRHRLHLAPLFTTGLRVVTWPAARFLSGGGQVKRKRSDSRRPRAVAPVRRWTSRAGGKAERRRKRRKVSGPNLKVCQFERHRSPRPRAPVWRLCGVRPLFRSRWIHRFLWF